MIDIDKNSFGRLVRSIRKDKGLSSTELVTQLRANTKSYLSRIELHDEIPSAEYISRLARILEYPAKKLFDLAFTIRTQKYREALDIKYKNAVEKLKSRSVA